MTPRLTKPLLEAIAAALNAALAGEIGEGDFAGMNREHFERALVWADAKLANRFQPTEE